MEEEQEVQPEQLSEEQKQFDELTQEKIGLWDSIKDNESYEQTEQWQEIRLLDEQLLALDAKIKGGHE